jgi:uncharacterized protein (TIGR02147 family)
MTGATETYRDLLKRELAWRSCANPAYSQRAFARDISIAPHRLSEILNNKRGLSKEAACKVAAKLNMSANDAEYFCNLVEAEHGRSHTKRQGAVSRLEQDHVDRVKLDPEEYDVLSDYRHLATIELLSMKNAKSNAASVAAKLSIPIQEAAKIISHLIETGFLQTFRSKLVPVFERTFFTNKTPSQAIRAFHAGLQQAGLKAIYEQPMEKRSIDALIFKVDPAAIPEIKKEIDRCIEKISRIASTSRRKTELYAITTHLFSLLKDQK